MKYSRLLMLSFLVFVCAATSRGQGFRKIYNNAGSKFRAVVETPDGGFFMAGSSSTQPAIFQLTNRVGNPIWTKTFNLSGAEPIAICQVADGGFVALTEYYHENDDYKNLVVKVSPAGTIQWQTPVANMNMENGLRDVLALPDGGVMLVGSARFELLNQDVRLLKINTDGSLAWSKSFGAPTADEFATRLLAWPDGSFVIGGFTAPVTQGSDIADFFLAKTDADGNVQWQHTYSKAGTQYAYDLIGTVDGGILLMGETQQTDPVDATVLKTDGNGTELWFQKFNPSAQIQGKLVNAYSIVEDNAGNLYLPGLTGENFSPDSTFLAFLSPSGQINQIKKYPYDDLTFQAIHTQDNKLVITGSSGNFFGNTNAFLTKLDLLGEVFGNYIVGSLYHDANDNCTQDPNEPGLPNFVVKAENAQGHIFYEETDATGTYRIFVSDGNFVLTAVPKFGQENIWGVCDTPSVAVAGLYMTANAPDIGMKSLTDCPYLDVDISGGIMRRCTTTRFTINYCNVGSAVAQDAYVVLTADDKFSYQGSSMPLSSQNGQEFRFNLGNVAPTNCGSFTADFKVACAAANGDVLCIEAHIFPDSLCLPLGSVWDGSHLKVEGACDGWVKFTIKNDGEGDMVEDTEYVIIEDQIIMMQGSVQLLAGEDTTVIIASTPNGKSYYLQTNQTTGHPVLSLPSATVQGCGGTNGANLLMELPQNESEAAQATHCDEVRGSFDPNDKRGFPLGWGNNHSIERNQALEYMIRFQNTGNDTAFLVEIRDTLTHLLNPATIRPGASSHPYTFELSGDGHLLFRFDNILLPDSNINEAASHGYVMFRVQQQPDLPLGSVIQNSAGIYFDFNDPIITNTTIHTVGQRLTSFVIDRPNNLVGLDILPNPVADEAIFSLQTAIPGAHLHFSLFNATGQRVRDEMFVTPKHRFQRQGLSSGIYLFSVTDQGRVVASGKVIVQ